uniref:Uncharacterized protein n=1 Tax=Glossina austeni TaxID=7395 RepID=A0A1A9UF55_GLOAU
MDCRGWQDEMGFGQIDRRKDIWTHVSSRAIDISNWIFTQFGSISQIVHQTKDDVDVLSRLRYLLVIVTALVSAAVVRLSKVGVAVYLFCFSIAPTVPCIHVQNYGLQCYGNIILGKCP